jgi:predicted nuclease of predicted toxin-antitoxin system
MRFVVDECTGTAVAKWLRAQQHDVFSVFEQARGASDDEILAKAAAEDRVLITNDKDFGEKVFRDRAAHKGVIFLRLDDERADNKIAVLQRLFAGYADQLAGRFVVVTELAVRIAAAP